MKYLLTVLTIVFTTVSVCSQTLPKDAKAEREILAFQKELSEAMNRKDRAMLERLIADGFTFIHSTGGMENRKEYIDNAVAGNLNSQNLNVEKLDEQIRVYGGNTAIWYGRGEMRNKTDNSIVSRLRHISVYIKVAGRWQLASGQSTKLPLRPQAKAINSQIYEMYVGRYAIDANRVLTVTRENGILNSQGTGRPKFELIPKSETEFMSFNEDNDYGNSEIVFVKDETGQVSHAVFRRDNKEVWRAKRIK